MNRRTFLKACSAAWAFCGLGGRSGASEELTGRHWDVYEYPDTPPKPERLLTFHGHPLVWSRPRVGGFRVCSSSGVEIPQMESYVTTTSDRDIVLDTSVVAVEKQLMMWGRAVAYEYDAEPLDGFDTELIYLCKHYVVDLSRDTEEVWRDVEGFEEIASGPTNAPLL